MTNTNKLVGTLLISLLTIGSILPSQYTIESFSDGKKALGIGMLAELAADEPSEAIGTIQQIEDTIKTSLSSVASTAQTYAKLTAATLTRTAALACGAHAYCNGYVSSNLNALIKSGYEAVKPIGTLIKQDLTIGELPQDYSTRNTSYQSYFLKKILKAARINGYLFLAKMCIAFVVPRSSPDTRQHNIPISWADMVIVAPILEELYFTGVGSLLLKNYAQIVVPPLFAAAHIVGPVTTLQDRNMKISLALITWLVNFVHQRVVRQNLHSELPVVIMSHMIHNQLAIACNYWLKKKVQQK